MSSVTRKYHCKDVDMIITAATVMEAAIKNKDFLQSKRSVWKDPFFSQIQKQIDEVTRTCLGADSAATLRKATQAINGIQEDAILLLAEVKVQVTEDFKSDKARRDEILNLLGFKGYHKDAQKGNQEALVQLLYHFKNNLSKELSAEIAGKGTDAAVLDKITQYADILKKAEVTQETYKGERKNITGANIEDLNDVYGKVISICKIATKFFKGKVDIQSQFNFKEVVKKLSLYPKNPPEPPKA